MSLALREHIYNHKALLGALYPADIVEDSEVIVDLKEKLTLEGCVAFIEQHNTEVELDLTSFDCVYIINLTPEQQTSNS